MTNRLLVDPVGKTFLVQIPIALSFCVVSPARGYLSLGPIPIANDNSIVPDRVRLLHKRAHRKYIHRRYK